MIDELILSFIYNLRKCEKIHQKVSMHFEESKFKLWANYIYLKKKILNIRRW
jgi:hypothetical protein